MMKDALGRAIVSFAWTVGWLNFVDEQLICLYLHAEPDDVLTRFVRRQSSMAIQAAVILIIVAIVFLRHNYFLASGLVTLAIIMLLIKASWLSRRITKGDFGTTETDIRVAMSAIGYGS